MDHHDATSRRSRAEALIHGAMPASSLLALACHDAEQQGRLEALARSERVNCPVINRRYWYFRGLPSTRPADTEGPRVTTARPNPRNSILITLSSHGRSYRVVGHAIVSADGMIADAQGLMPAPLRNDADWAIFQAALDRSSLVVLGSIGHGRHPNPGRRRLVFTSSVEQLAPDAGDRLATFYNPAGLPVGELLARLDVTEGVVAVTGGQRVFDHFLPLYDEFMLAEVEPFVLPGGTSCFGAGHPRAVLAAAGLAPFERQAIDPDNGVTLTRWQRPGGRP